MVQHSSIDHTGLTGVGTNSYASNANSVASASAGGAATTQSRGDHVHLGVRSISHTSNTFSGPITFVAEGNLGITSPSTGTLAFKATSGAAASGGGGGALVLLEQHTGSSSATLDFTTCISSTYDEYMVEFIDVLPATNATALKVRVSTNGGSSWDSTTNYYDNAIYATTTWTFAAAAASSVQIAHDVNATAAILGVTGSIRVVPSGSQHRWFVGQAHYLTSGSIRAVHLINGDYDLGAFNALRFFFSSGNIASGTIRVYGIAKS